MRHVVGMGRGGGKDLKMDSSRLGHYFRNFPTYTVLKTVREPTRRELLSRHLTRFLRTSSFVTETTTVDSICTETTRIPYRTSVRTKIGVVYRRRQLLEP